jgi:pimeloyl-ACP methyl ester carboxylesterase
MTIHDFPLNAETLRVREAGSSTSPSIFFFHSLGTSSELWVPQFEALAQTHHLIAMDCRGHGGSTNRGGFSVHACAADALAVLRELHVSRTHVVGVSMGGLMTAELAACMAADHSGVQCASITLACSYRYAGGPQAQARIDATAAMMQEKGMAEFARIYMDGTACEYMDADTKRHMAGIIAGMKEPDYLQAIASILTHDAGPAFARLRGVPALVLSGKLDQRVSAAALADLKAAVPRAHAVELEKAGHLANIEDAAGFNRALLAFLARPQPGHCAPAPQI